MNFAFFGRSKFISIGNTLLEYDYNNHNGTSLLTFKCSKISLGNLVNIFTGKINLANISICI